MNAGEVFPDFDQSVSVPHATAAPAGLISGVALGLSLLLAALCAVSGCSAMWGLKQEDVASIIANSDAFRQPRTYQVDFFGGMGDCSKADTEHPRWRPLLELGLVRTRVKTETSKPIELAPGRPMVVSVPTCILELTEEGRRQSGNWAKPRPPSKADWEIPIATRQLVSVVRVVQKTDDADVTFAWRWQPNSIGQKLGGLFPDADGHTSNATLRRDEKQWRVVSLSGMGNSGPS